MGAEIAANVPLDSVKFQILQENRFNAFICSKENEEMAGHGFLDQLLYHLPNIKDKIAKEHCDYFKLELPEKVHKREWFTKSTLSRFLRIVGSSDLVKCVAITNETCQLEETRKVEDGIASSNNSKNELLEAIDSRIYALMKELVSTFNSAIGETLSSQEMMDLREFCQHFVDVEDISNLLSKLSEASQKDPFPTKVGAIESQILSEIEGSCFSSEDEQPSVIRYSSSRRSSSPMRRIQVGRSGTRRTPALTIKSLTCCPARKPEDEPEKKIEVDVTRISVQDAISLFESKQRDQKVDTQNSKSFGDNSISAKKSVLRGWSSGNCDFQKSKTQSIVEHTASADKSELEDEDVLKSEEVNPDQSSVSENPISETVKFDAETENTVNLNEDWNRKKEEELSQILMKFAQNNQINHKNVEPDSSKNHDSRFECNNGADGQKEMRKVDNTGKRVQKPAVFRPKQKIQEKPKAEKTFVKVNGGKKQTTKRTQKDIKDSSVSLKSKEESKNPNGAKRVSFKKSFALPAARTKNPPLKSQSAAPCQKPRSRPNPQVERSEVKQSKVKRAEFDTKKGSKKVDEGKNRVLSNSGKSTKMNTLMVVNKSTVVTLAAKLSSPQKGSEISPVSIPYIQKEESPAMVKESLSENFHYELERKIDTENPKTDSEKEVYDEISPGYDEIDERMPEFSAEIHPVVEVEPVISPSVWEEISHKDTVSSSEPMVRQSLSHILLQESCKPDVIHYQQKNSHKGFKRLLKFTRKNTKGETNEVAVTSLYTSEAEENGDECRTNAKKNSDNLTRKASLHSKNYAERHGSSKGTRSLFSLSAFRGNKD